LSVRAPVLVLSLAALVAVACTSSRAAVPARKRTPGLEVGGVSYYHDSLAGRSTASGEPYDPALATCAHRRYRFGTKLKITVVATGRTAFCRVNDRGPFVRGRVLDVSRALAEELGIVKAGVVRARVQRVKGS
jgi:rare lipoprotein A